MGLLAVLLLVAGCEDSDPVRDYRVENTRDTAWGIAYLTGYLFNGFIATRQAGPQDVTVRCSRGGSIRIAGRTEYDSQTALLSMDLTYEFAAANVSVVATNLAVTFHPLAGAIRQTGTVRIGGEFYENTVAVSTGLVYDVTIDRPDRDAGDLADEGPYAVTIWTTTNRVNEVYRNMSGELNAVGFSWGYCVSLSCGTNFFGDVYVEL
jgi:hypothetical protein